MYAVIKTGGKQHKVKTGDVIEVEKLAHGGETITFHPILVVDDDGATHVGAEAAKATVTAQPLGEKKGEKVKIFKYRPKTGYAKRGGHRQLITLLEIQDVTMGGAAKKAPAKKAAAPKTGTKVDAAEDKAEAAPEPEAAPVEIEATEAAE